MKILHSVFMTAVFCVVVAQNQQSSAQGTAFSYQGHLTVGGAPANGSYDLQFEIYPTNATGVAIAGPVTNAAVVVSNGLFTTAIDFGPGVFEGESNWLDIAVRTNNGSAFTELAPRLAVLPTPYAIYAATASNVSGTVSSAQLVGTIPTSQLNGTISISSVTGTVPLGQLPGAVVTNGETGVTLSGGFTGTLAGNASSATAAATAGWATNVVSGINITNVYITNSVYAGDGSGLINLNVSASQLTSIGNNNGGADNFFIGIAGNATISGSDNTAVGFQALFNNNGGSDNAAFGLGALFDNNNGSKNTATGFGALNLNTIGGNNTANGFDALHGNVSGSDNTAFGYQALGSSTSGTNNIALGYGAGGNFTLNESSNIDIGNVGVANENNVIRIGTPGIQTNAIIAGVINGNGGGLTNLNAAQLSSGVIPLAQLPTVVVTNNSTGLNLSGTFSGNGGGLTGLDASQLTSIGNTNGGFANFFISNAGNSTTTGSGNLAVAGGSLILNSSGSDNAAFGSAALNLNTVGSDNTAMGFRALEFSTNGSDSTAIGFRTLQASKTSFENTAIGSGALLNNSTGSNNIAIGFNAGDNITTTSSNIDLGSPGVSGDQNTIRIGTVGIQTSTVIAGTINGDGGGLTGLDASQLTSIGNTNGGFANFFISNAGNSTTTGSGNLAVAGGSLILNSSGSDNAAFGSAALNLNTVGSDNTAMGFRALEFSTNGSDSTAIGFRTLQASKTSFENTAIGSGALLNNSTGSNNIAIGFNAGDNITTTSSNIDLGSPGVSGDQNTIRIGTVGIQTSTVIAGVVNNAGGVQVGANGTAMTTIESGQAVMPASSLQETNFTITFPTAFSSSPKIIFSLANDPNFQSVSDVFTANVSSNSAAAFSINVYRLNGTSWSQSLRVNWQAWQ